ncbi:MAG TPA: helix-turn-helix transcriptional regulator [Streptomyces sp.]|nr:helix-turn-helix transcriptional regulator [Streptomyces sp.]
MPDEHRADPAHVEVGAAIARGQAVHDRRTALGLSHQQLAERSGTAETGIERIEGGAVAPALDPLRVLAQALDARPVLSVEADETSVTFAAPAA